MRDILNLIPNAFYDLAVRIMPGLTFIAVGYIIFIGPDITIQNIKVLLGFYDNKNLSIALIFFSLILISYMIVIMVNGLGLFFKDYLEIYKHPEENDLKEAFKKINPKLQKNYEFPSFIRIYEHLLSQAPEILVRIDKLRSEKHMCCTLSFGFAILTIINLVNFFRISEFYSQFPKILILEFILLLCSLSASKKCKDFKIQFVESLCTHWFLLKEYGLKNKKDNETKNEKRNR